MDKTIYVGWDSRETIAYDVCIYSLKKHSGEQYKIKPVEQNALRLMGLYQRPINEPASTEFTFSRFLVPFLNNYEGIALFCDCDFVFTQDVKHLFKYFNPKQAVQVVKHDYIPKDSVKMDGQKQVSYPRKNWSSLILFNCSHPSTKKLTPEIINNKPGSYLHRFEWCEDHEIGEIPLEWNFLAGEYDKLKYTPAAIHYTLGGPWFDNYKDIDYAEVWNKYKQEMQDMNGSYNS